MFYSTNILQKKGPLGTIWIAAHHDVAKKLTKLQVLNTDIVESAGEQFSGHNQTHACLFAYTSCDEICHFVMPNRSNRKSRAGNGTPLE